ncbi:MAG: glutathione S-transferase family protein [Burkholderiales bacterium]
MLKVWGRKSSSNVQAVMWCIAELELPVERIDAGFKYGVVDTPAYLAMNPNGTVPTLQDGDRITLWESGAILRYLANNYADGPFWPSDIAARARIDMWAEWAKLNVALKFGAPIFWQIVRTPPERRDALAIARAVTEFERMLKIADAQLQKSAWLASDDFTLADIQFGHLLYRYFNIEIDRSPPERIVDYYGKLKQRSCFQDHVMVSYEELRDPK